MSLSLTSAIGRLNADITLPANAELYMDFAPVIFDTA